MNTTPLPPAQRHAPVLLWVVGICAVLEAVFTLFSLPALGLGNLRSIGVVYGAFWPGLLDGWTQAYAGQKVLMFISYAFLHGGLLHMVFNMLILLHLGREAVNRLGQGGFVLVFILTSIGSAAVYGALTTNDAPMLGASGVVFGLFGTTMFWDYQRRRAVGASLEPVGRLLIGLIVMNVLLYFLVGGMLAWQAHLGGFVTGLALAAVITPSLGHRHRP